MANMTYEDKIGILWCIERGYLDIIKSLAKKPNLNFKNNEFITSACRHGRLDIMVYLVEFHGIDVRANNEAMKEAIINNHLDCVKYLTDCGVPLVSIHNPLILAIRLNDYSMVKYILLQNDNFASILDDALYLACEISDVPIVGLILNKFGNNALAVLEDYKAIDIALDNHNLNVVRLLSTVMLGKDYSEFFTAEGD